MGPLCFSACNRPLGDRLRCLTKGAVCEGPSPNGTTKEKAISRRLFRSSRLVGLAVVLGLFASPAPGHVNLLAPNEGEAMQVCSQFSIRWQIQIAHNLLNWDLWYSTTGAAGPWTSRAVNLPPGSGDVGSIHTYTWTVPAVIDSSVWVRVRMDNSATDYYDVSLIELLLVFGETCP